MGKSKFFGIGLINELIELKKTDTITLSNTLVIKKAVDHHIRMFKHYCEIFKSKYWQNYFENEFLVKGDLNETRKLNKNNWRYSILEFDGFQLNNIDQIL